MPSPDATPLLPYLSLLPELDRLRGLVENRDWHNDDPYEQSLRLARWVEELPAVGWTRRLTRARTGTACGRCWPSWR